MSNITLNAKVENNTVVVTNGNETVSPYQCLTQNPGDKITIHIDEGATLTELRFYHNDGEMTPVASLGHYDLPDIKVSGDISPTTATIIDGNIGDDVFYRLGLTLEFGGVTCSWDPDVHETKGPPVPPEEAAGPDA